MNVAAWMTPQQELATIQAAARRVGCRVLSAQIRETMTGPRAAVELACRSGWDAARLLLALGVEDAKTAGARDLALEIRRDHPEPEDFARAVHAFVRENVAFVREPGEAFTSPSYTLAAGAGDCDDHARLAYALLRAGGLPARLAFLSKPGAHGPSHVLAVAGVDGRWEFLETTIDADFGEHPIAAGRRLGVMSQREDLTSQVSTMSEKDLPPPPPSFDTRNPGAILAADSRALGALAGVDLDAPSSASSPAFRALVAAFQTSHGGLRVDGLIGPKTRAALLDELRAQGMGELADGYQATIAGADGAGMFTHEQARAIVRAVFPGLFGRPPTENEEVFACAVAFAETGYGRAGQFGGFASRGIYNWGALERGRPPCGDGFVEGTDGGRPVCFYAFTSDEAAARAFLQTWGKPDTLAAAQTGDAFQVAQAMRRHGYYEGFWVPPGNPQHQPMPPFKEAPTAAEAERRNVADYATFISRNVNAVTHGAGIPDPPHGLAVAGGLGGALLLLAVLGGAAYYAHRAGYIDLSSLGLA